MLKHRRAHACIIVLAIVLFAREAMAADIFCGSPDGEFNHCSLQGADRMKVKLRQHLDGICKYGQSWGVDQTGVWVDMGCRGIFRYTAPSAQQAGWRRFLPRWTK